MFLYLRCYVDVLVWTRWTTLSWPWTLSTVLFNHCSVIVITCQQVETGVFYKYKFFLFQEPCSRTTLLLHHYSTILLKQCWTISCWSDNVRQCALFRQQLCDKMPFQRHKFRKISGGTCPGNPYNCVVIDCRHSSYNWLSSPSLKSQLRHWQKPSFQRNRKTFSSNYENGSNLAHQISLLSCSLYPYGTIQTTEDTHTLGVYFHHN